jgi:hypothetical protein
MDQRGDEERGGLQDQKALDRAHGSDLVKWFRHVKYPVSSTV